MKENSIERDIHLLQSYAGMTHKMNDNQGRPKLDQAIERILKDYKRVLKENEELNEKILDNAGIYQLGFKDGEESYIKKVKDKIEKLNKKEQKLQNSISSEEREEYSDANISLDLMDINIKREVLQELIEER